MTETWSERNFWPAVWAIALAMLGLRLVFIMVWRADAFSNDYVVTYGDSLFYHAAGNQLADGLGWINPWQYIQTGETVQAADHPPLYIAFLGFWSWLGFEGWVEHMVLTAVWISTPMVIMCGLAGREIGGRRLGIIAALVAALYPNIWAWDGTVLSEPVAMLTVATMVYVAFRFWRRPSMSGAVWMGVVLSFAAFARAELLLMSVLVVMPLVLRVRDWPWRNRLAALVIAGVSSMAVLAPWVAFNLSRFDERVYLSEGFQVTLATSTCDKTYYGDGIGYWNYDCIGGYLDEVGLTRDNSEQPERSKALLDGSLRYIGDHLDRLPVVVAVRWLRIVGLWKPAAQARTDAMLESRNQWVTFVAQASGYVFMALAAVGAVQLRRRRTSIVPLVGPLIAVLITITITFAQNRYRASIEPVVAILAAVALESMVRGWFALRDDPEDQPSPDSVSQTS
jgi:4-amino-4-deoxy-L-arabinose transferase-like glycosyltransferase